MVTRNIDSMIQYLYAERYTEIQCEHCQKIFQRHRGLLFNDKKWQIIRIEKKETITRDFCTYTCRERWRQAHTEKKHYYDPAYYQCEHCGQIKTRQDYKGNRPGKALKWCDECMTKHGKYYRE